MGTAEILIVFSALMALISLVTIGIDWIGKPLKNRRFIPRIYRFEDEKLPVDAYGNTRFDPRPAPGPMMPPVVHHQPAQSAPRQVARVAVESTRAQSAIARPPTPQHAVGAAAGAAVAATTKTAFSDSLANAVPSSSGTTRDRALIAGTEPTPPEMASSVWRPGMPLDTNVDGRKPSLATKAERFWMTAAEAIGSTDTSHFADDDIARMASGKAPRRTNPRTGRPEAMQLTGLRRASTHKDVRMRWPDDSVDPWNAS